jgi:hypothetical protein
MIYIQNLIWNLSNYSTPSPFCPRTSVLSPHFPHVRSPFPRNPHARAWFFSQPCSQRQGAQLLLLGTSHLRPPCFSSTMPWHLLGHAPPCLDVTVLVPGTPSPCDGRPSFIHGARRPCLWCSVLSFLGRTRLQHSPDQAACPSRRLPATTSISLTSSLPSNNRMLLLPHLLSTPPSPAKDIDQSMPSTLTLLGMFGSQARRLPLQLAVPSSSSDVHWRARPSTPSQLCFAVG